MLRQAVTRGERHQGAYLNVAEAELLRTATAHRRRLRVRARNRRNGELVPTGQRGGGRMRRIALTALVAATIAPADSALAQTVHWSGAGTRLGTTPVGGNTGAAPDFFAMLESSLVDCAP